MNRRTLIKGVAAIGLAALACDLAAAQTYPTKPIRILVPAPAGSPPDILARIIGNALGESEGWTVVVENKPGGAMTIGTNEALRQPADGYTVLSVTSPITAAAALVPSANFDIENDFKPVIKVGVTYNVLVVNPKMPVRTLPEFVVYLKKDPGKYTFSSGGFGTPAHLLGELFKLKTGVQTVHVPYKGNSQTIPDLMSGINTYQFISAVAVVQLIESGKLRALVAMSKNRVPALPDVPTIVEVGYPNLAGEDWAGFLVKTGTPAPIMAQLNAAINKVLKTEKVQQAFARVGTDLAGGTPEEFGKLIRAEVAHWTKVIKDADIKIN